MSISPDQQVDQRLNHLRCCSKGQHGQQHSGRRGCIQRDSIARCATKFDESTTTRLPSTNPRSMPDTDPHPADSTAKMSYEGFKQRVEMCSFDSQKLEAVKMAKHTNTMPHMVSCSLLAPMAARVTTWASLRCHLPASIIADGRPSSRCAQRFSFQPNQD